MAVYRVQRTRDYTVMSNYHLKDKNLTLKSKGLLSMILSLVYRHGGNGGRRHKDKGCVAEEPRDNTGRVPAAGR